MHTSMYSVYLYGLRKPLINKVKTVLRNIRAAFRGYSTLGPIHSKKRKANYFLRLKNP